MSSDKSQIITVMTYNTHHSSGYDDRQPTISPISCAEGIRKVERLAQVVAAQRPHIVGLQEVDRFWPRSGVIDQAAVFASNLDMRAEYGANVNNNGEQFGVTTLTTFPIISGENSPLPTPAGWETRGMLDVRVSLPDHGEIAIINTHLQSNANGEHTLARKQRSEHAMTIADYVSVLTCPAIVLGDFNADPGSGDIDPLIQIGLTDVWQTAGAGEGYTVITGAHGEKTSRIDYIFISHHFEVRDVSVIDTPQTRVTSDHLPLVARLKLRRSHAE